MDIWNLLISVLIWAAVAIFMVAGAYFMVIGLLKIIEIVFFKATFDMTFAIEELLGGVSTMLADIFFVLSLIWPVMTGLPMYKVDDG